MEISSTFFYFQNAMRIYVIRFIYFPVHLFLGHHEIFIYFSELMKGITLNNTLIMRLPHCAMQENVLTLSEYFSSVCLVDLDRDKAL